MPFATVGDLDMYFELYGDEGDVPLLAISGTGNDLRTSFPSSLPLNESFRVLHYDQRGLGQTSAPPGQWEMAQYADDAAGLVRSLGWDRCHVVGTSFGGMVAQHLAIRHPELVDRLVLNCTSPGGPRPSFPLDTIEALDAEARLEMMLGLFDNRWDPGADEPIPGLWFYDIMIERMRVPRPAETMDGYLRQLDARSRHDATSGLPSLVQPTLVCAGEFDDLAPPYNSELLTELIPNARLQRFNGGHLFFVQDDTAYPAMVSFLQGNDD